MRITIEATDDVVELTRAREFIDAMLAPRAAVRAVDTSAHVDTLNITLRALNTLRAADICTVAQLCRCTRHDLMILPNLGSKSLREITEALAERGLSLADDGGDDE